MMEESIALATKIGQAREKYESYESKCWTQVYFDNFSGGFNVYHKAHQFSQIGGGGDAEKIVGRMLAECNGKQVEFLPEGGRKSPDFRFDGQTWDVKFIEKANEETIRTHIRDAQKADNVIFYFGDSNKLKELISAKIREVGRQAKNNTLMKMPNIYYLDEARVLQLLWAK
ncbi:hypothetical protein AGMMS49982_15050 [Bacteroidia bacterium]|nr:hypothetical protein AGMMS49982_15050 [Bacteroidia bacterium]